MGAGVSLSSGSRSAVAINPDSPQAEALRAWWNTEGRSSALSPLTQEQRWVCRHDAQTRQSVYTGLRPQAHAQEDCPGSEAEESANAEAMA